MEWRDIPGFPGYIVSEDGQVARVLKGRVLHGYRRFQLKRALGRAATLGAHRAVALAFLGPPTSPRMDAAHENGGRQDNRPGNLRWATRGDNLRDRTRHGTHNGGERSPFARLDWRTVDAIRAAYAAGTTSFTALGRQFGVSRKTPWRIIKGACWRDEHREPAP